MPAARVSASQILLVDDDRDTCALLGEGLAGAGYQVDVAHDAAGALDRLSRRHDAAIVDVVIGDVSGIDLCRDIRRAQPELPIVVITGHGDTKIALAAMRAGAHDFITKPASIDTLSRTLERAIRSQRIARRVGELRTAGPWRCGGLVGESPEMLEIFDLIKRVAASDATTLVTGESGTGKDLIARAIHEGSPRAALPFVALNCAAHETLLEAELFGHVKGAFTDAREARGGMFVDADGGTIFLDEIGEMPLSMQPKLLRVLQERRVRPLGGDREIEFDVRIIAATNRDLFAEVGRGRFREDLYYRLDVVKIEAPPLRARGGDVLILAQHFIERFAAESDKRVIGITPPAAERLLAYDWPGNVRELENTIARAVTLTRYAEITVADLPARVVAQPIDEVVRGLDPAELPTLEEVEANHIRRVLEGVDGNKSRAARILGLNRRTLYRKVKRFDIDVERAQR